MNHIKVFEEYTQKIKELTERQITAFHGSGKKFDEFSLEHSETGTGGNAYGWGIYFSTDDGVASNYAKNVLHDTMWELYYKYGTKSEKHLRREGYDLNRFGSLFHVFYRAYSKGREAMKEEIFAFYRIKEADEIIDILIPYCQKLEKVRKDAYVYSVTLHQGKTPDQYDYLHWDSYITDAQYTKIAKQMREEKLPQWVDKKIKGCDVYEILTRNLSKKETSMLLLRAGIDGMKVDDENIVLVYDTKNITVDQRQEYQKNKKA
jgi:hypothetical protein